MQSLRITELYLKHGFNQPSLVLGEVREGHGAGPDPLHLPQLPLHVLLLLRTVWVLQQHARAEEVLLLLQHHLQAVLEILPTPFHQRVFTQKLPGGFVDEQGEAVPPGGRLDKDARSVEAAVAIVEGNLLCAQILFDVCDCDGADGRLQRRLCISFKCPGPTVCQEVAFAPKL